jgi:hypothetical protein
MLAGLRQSGHDPTPLLEKAGIVLTPDGVDGQRIPVARYAELYNLINRELDDEGFGLFSLPIRVGAFSSADLLAHARAHRTTAKRPMPVGPSDQWNPAGGFGVYACRSGLAFRNVTVRSLSQ